MESKNKSTSTYTASKTNIKSSNTKTGITLSSGTKINASVGQKPLEKTIPKKDAEPKTVKSAPKYTIPDKAVPYLLPCNNKEYWTKITTLLTPITQGKADINYICTTISKIALLSQEVANFNTTMLEGFYSNLSNQEKTTFLKTTIPKVASLIFQTSTLFPKGLFLLSQDLPHKLVLSKLQVACLLSNMFFGTLLNQNNKKLPQTYLFTDYFDGSFSQEPLKVEKIKCIYNYFLQIPTLKDQYVIFERRVLTENSQKQCDLQSWINCDLPLLKTEILSSGSISDVPDAVSVDFANMCLGGGALWCGMLQEEIAFSLSPECMVGIVLSEIMLDHEAIVIKGVEKCSIGEGYADEFKCVGIVERKKEDNYDQVDKREILAVDALCFMEYEKSYQYEEKGVLRELNKIFVGLWEREGEEIRNKKVATGRWGCGAFKGDPEIKFCIQWMASSRSGREMVFCNFGGGEYVEKANMIEEKWRGKNVGEMMEMLMEYGELVKGKEEIEIGLFDYILKK